MKPSRRQPDQPGATQANSGLQDASGSSAHAGRAGLCPRSVLLFLTVTALVLTADLVSKSLAFTHVAGQPIDLRQVEPGHHPASVIPYHDPITLVPWVLSLRLTANTGAIFGLGQGNKGLLVATSLLATLVIGYLFFVSRPRDRLLHISLALLLAGALGNLYDRLIYNAVRDLFWLFPGLKLPFNWQWPGGSDDLYPWIFNLADVVLLVGVGISFLLLWRADRRPQTAPADPH